ncbi:MAG: hypothetical protein LBU19_02025 [Treponema sp.]|jgi:hypothetical protein|nr:hypothetical protein [Treponema sp.]
MDILTFLPGFIFTAVVLVVILTEAVKKIDTKDRLKGYRVYIPLGLSLGAAGLLRVGNFFVPEQMWFWWAVIFGFSVFAYEAVLRKLESVFNKDG